MDIEKKIIQGLRVILNNRKLKADDLQEWSSNKEAIEENIQNDKEVYVYVPTIGVHCAVLKTADKRKEN